MLVLSNYKGISFHNLVIGLFVNCLSYIVLSSLLLFKMSTSKKSSSSTELQMFDSENILPALPKVDSPMLDNTNDISSGGVSLPNMGTPMFDIANRPREENSVIRSVILKVPAGTDLVGWVVAFAKEKKVYMTVQGGNVPVSEAHIRFLGDPVTPPQVYKEEHLNLINFSGSYMFSCPKQGSATYFNALLSRKDGVVGGTASKIITMGEVILSATVFKNPQLFKLKPEIRKGHAVDSERP